MLAAACVAAGLWSLLFVDGPLFNLAAPLTGEFEVYHATCEGWVLRPAESIGGSGTCFGSYTYLGGRTTYRVNVPNQKVWMWQEPTIYEGDGGWVSLTQRSADPAEQKTCEVLDYSNWACSDSDQYGTTITQLVGGREHLYEYGKLSPAGAVLHGLASSLGGSCDVQVDAVTSWVLWFGQGGWKLNGWPVSHRLIAKDWTDCTHPPP